MFSQRFRRMRVLTRIGRGLSLALAATFATCLCVTAAEAQTLNLSLNLIYDDPMDVTSGGDWQLVGKSSHAGIAVVEALLRNVNFASVAQAAPQGIVNGGDAAGFNEFLVVPGPGYTRIFVGQRSTFPTGGEQEGAFYGVGALTNGSPNFPGKPAGTNSIGPNYTSLTNVFGVPWATGDVFSDPAWNTAAILATGTFASGVTPSFFQSGDDISKGSVFTSLGSATTFGPTSQVDPITSAIVRTNLMLSPFDYNDNGKVDAADYTIWRDTLGSTTDLRADGNNDNVINQLDYDLWKANFGSGAGSGSALGASGAVPEPAAGTLFILAACSLAHRRSISRRSLLVT